MVISGDELVKSEQSTLHICDFCSSGCARSGDAQGDKKFFRFYCSHCSPLVFINNFMVIQGEYTVKGEQWSVHPVAMSRKKRPAVAGLELVMLLRVPRISAASRRSFPLSATDWFVSPALCAASHNSGRILSASWAAPARTFSG